MLLKPLRLAVLLTLAIPLSGFADTILTFYDLTDTVTYSGSDGVPHDCVNAAHPEACTLGATTAPGSFPAVNDLFNIYGQDGVTLSDTLSITRPNPDGSQLIVAFISDVEGTPLAPLAGGTSIIEDGTVQTADRIALTGPLAGQNFIVQFQSDVSDVPEPASVGLLITVMAGCGIAVKRRRGVGKA